MKKERVTWISKEVEVKNIKPTEKNYKIRNALGRERLQQSLAKFGLAGNVVCNWHGKFNDLKTLMLIDGNSRLEDELKQGTKKLWVSLPSRKLTPKEFVEMSAVFDLAKAGDVDIERIQGDIGKTKDFYDEWNLTVPRNLLDKLGAKQVNDYKKQKFDKKEIAGAKITADRNLNDLILIELVFNTKQADDFRKQEARLAAKYKTKTTGELVLKLMLQSK